MVRGQSAPAATPTISTANAGRWCASSARPASSSCASPTARRRPDVRSLAIARETLAYHSALADFAFAMQGLGSGAIWLFGTVEQKRAVAAARSRAGEAIAAFAMTEPECGSDAANIATSAMRDGNEWVLVGEKTLHLQRRHRRFLPDLRAHRRRRRRARAVARSSSPPTRSRSPSGSRSSRRTRSRG